MGKPTFNMGMCAPGGCCSEISAVPENILPDPEDATGYTVKLDYLGNGDTYEIMKEEGGEWHKWLNIRRYGSSGTCTYKLENYVRPKEGDARFADHEHEGEVLASANADNFSPDDYHYKHPEEVSESGESDYSDSPDDPGEFQIHKAKWKVENTVVICDKDGVEIGSCHVKAKGSCKRHAEIVERHDEHGEVCGKDWKIDYDGKIKKIKYTLKLEGHEDVKFKLKGSCNHQCMFEWETANFVAKSDNRQKSDIQTFDGHNPSTGMLMGFICTQVLCPGDIKDGCEPSRHDGVFPRLGVAGE